MLLFSYIMDLSLSLTFRFWNNYFLNVSSSGRILMIDGLRRCPVFSRCNKVQHWIATCRVKLFALQNVPQYVDFAQDRLLGSRPRQYLVFGRLWRSLLDPHSRQLEPLNVGQGHLPRPLEDLLSRQRTVVRLQVRPGLVRLLCARQQFATLHLGLEWHFLVN